MIITPPTDLRRYFGRHRDKIEALLASIETVRAAIAAHGSEDSQRMLMQFLRYADETSDHFDLVWSADHFAHYRFNKMDLDWLKGSIDSVLTHGSSFLKYIVSACERIEPLDAPSKAFFQSVKNAGAGAEIYGFVPDDPANLADPDYTEPLALSQALQTLGEIYAEAEAIGADMSQRIAATIDLRNRLDPHHWRPMHDPVETVWHASIYASDLMENGFSSCKPEHRKGIGNYGPQQTISFTAEYEIAQAVADCFVDIWDIAHGFINAHDILELIKDEGLDINLKEYFQDGVIAEPSDPETTVKLYRVYLAFTATRPNPVIVHPEELLEAMRTVRRDQIGILACTVRLDSNYDFVPAEAEFRLTVDSVVSIDSFDHISAHSLPRSIVKTEFAL